MHENNIPEIAETKLPRTVTRSIINREITSFINFSETIEQQTTVIEEQKTIIEEQRKNIIEYKKEAAFRQELLETVVSDDRIVNKISDIGLQSHLNRVCKKHNKPLWYPWEAAAKQTVYHIKSKKK